MKELPPGKECCDKLHKTDGRDDDGKDHKGDWGNHSTADRLFMDEVSDVPLVRAGIGGTSDA